MLVKGIESLHCVGFAGSCLTVSNYRSIVPLGLEILNLPPLLKKPCFLLYIRRPLLKLSFNRKRSRKKIDLIGSSMG